MNKLTTIKTITKAAPLALLAVVLSGSAFARGPNQDPQASIDGYNECVYSSIDMGGNPNPTLVVDVMVKNTSGDTLVDAEVSEVVVQGTKKTRGKPGNLGGLNTTTFDPAKKIDEYDEFVSVHKEYIDICSALTVSEKYMDVSLNAEIDVTVDNSRKGTFSGKCDDDPATNCYDSTTDTYYVCELYDESIIQVDASSCK